MRHSDILSDNQTFAPRDTMKSHLVRVLMDMCELRQLSSITVAELTARAGISRRTFYNYFLDLNDLISYAASLPLMSGMLPFATVDNFLLLLKTAKSHPGFYRQVAAMTGQNNYRAAHTEWMRRNYCEFFVDQELPDDERTYRSALVDIFVVGATNFVFEWIEGGMQMPEEEVIRIVFDAAPDFVRVRVAHTPNEMPDYPR